MGEIDQPRDLELYQSMMQQGELELEAFGPDDQPLVRQRSIA